MKTMTAVLAATAMAAFAVAPPAQAGGVYGEAFGIAAKGVVALAPTPYVKAKTEEVLTKTMVKIPANPLVSGVVNEASASKYHARAAVADLVVGQLGLRAEAVTATCDNGVGGTALAKVKIGPSEIPLYPKPNSGVKLPLGALGKAEVTLNKQVRLPGGGLEVTAIHIDLSLVGAVDQTIDIASVTCARAPRPAPTPVLIPGDLPVTG
ncbi:hypothetical protein GCM10027589_42240 [Actinocorallia lasiicapitis]